MSLASQVTVTYPLGRLSVRKLVSSAYLHCTILDINNILLSVSNIVITNRFDFNISINILNIEMVTV